MQSLVSRPAFGAAANRLVGLVGLVGLLSSPLCTAAVNSLGRAEVQTRIDGVHVVRVDPGDGGNFETTGGNFRLNAGTSGVSANPAGGALLAQSFVTAVDGKPRLLLITDNTTTNRYTSNASSAYGAALVTFAGTIQGPAAADGWLTLEGLMLATVSPGGGTLIGLPTTAQATLHTWLQLSRPGGCPRAQCEAGATLSQNFENGAFPVYDGHDDTMGLPYLFQLPVKVGDSFVLSFGVGATAANGYAVAIGNARDPSRWPLALAPATGRLALHDANFAATDAPAGQGPFADLFGSLSLSAGLSLSADSGLVQQPDGRWAPAVSPVPELPTLALMAAGLLCMAGRRRALRLQAVD